MAVCRIRPNRGPYNPGKGLDGLRPSHPADAQPSSAPAGGSPLLMLGDMAIQRMDNVAIVVDDLDAAITFFAELGMELEGKAQIEGLWVHRTVGLDGLRSEIAKMRTPDGHSKLELTKQRPSADAGTGFGR
jgi:hypothetical protein